MFEIAELQSEEERKKVIEDALKLMKKVHSLQIEFMKWRMEVRKEELSPHHSDRPYVSGMCEGEFDERSNEDQEETKGKQLKGLEILYHHVIEKVIHNSYKNHHIKE